MNMGLFARYEGESYFKYLGRNELWFLIIGLIIIFSSHAKDSISFIITIVGTVLGILGVSFFLWKVIDPMPRKRDKSKKKKFKI